jgi:hypothetical protein
MTSKSFAGLYRERSFLQTFSRKIESWLLIMSRRYLVAYRLIVDNSVLTMTHLFEK